MKSNPETLDPVTPGPATQRDRGSFRILRRGIDLVLDFWFAPLPVERFRLWQRVFTLTFIYFIGQWSMYGAEWLTDVGYHISKEATSSVSPDPFPLLPREWLVPFLVMMFASALCVAFDVGGRALKLLVFGVAIYIQLVDSVSSFTLNKLYIFGFFLIAFAPSPQPIKNAEGQATAGLQQSAWPVRMIQLTLLIQYGDAGLCKVLHGDWLTKFDILYGHSIGVYRTEIAGWLMNHMPPIFWIVSSAFALLFELGAPLLFGVRKLRWVGILSGTAMHVVIAALMKDLIFFSLQMISFYVVFFPDDLCRRLEGKIAKAMLAVRQRLLRRSAATS